MYEELSFGGWDCGTYAIKITYNAESTDDIEFTVVIDHNPGPTVTIKGPQSSENVISY